MIQSKFKTIYLATLLLTLCSIPLTAQTNPIEKFSFLIGDFVLKGKTLSSPNTYSEYTGVWSGKYALDGTAIVEEFKIHGPQGQPVFFGMTTRAFNQKENKWVMGYFDALNPAWYPLGDPVFQDDGSITFFGRFPGMNENQKLRISFFDIAMNSFKWKSDISMDNGETWIEDYTIIEVVRK